MSLEEHAKKNPIPAGAVKEILAKLDCGCTHPETLHHPPEVTGGPTAKIPDGACRVSGCDCESFEAKKPEPEVRLCRLCFKFKQLKEELCVACLDRNIHERMMILVERIEELEADNYLHKGLLNS